ncbi:MAG: PaaI family thioesterase [Polyangiales bacterium]
MAEEFDKARILPILDQGFRGMVPHNAALGLRVVDCAPGMVILELPWREDLVGNPETGVLHGGAITTLLDAASGASVFLRLKSPIPIATLDLRIDYLRPATAHSAVRARAECYRLTRNVAFTRAIAFHGDDHSDQHAIASAAGTFMLSTKGKSVYQRSVKT